MAKKNFDELAKSILELVGGKENITYFAHCTTRLRFNLKDRSKADLEKIKLENGVVGTQWTGEELQIIIGTYVASVYDEICKVGDIAKADAIDENLDSDLIQSKFSLKKMGTDLINGISGSITPLIYMMAGAGLIKALTVILSMSGILSAESSTFQVLSWVGDGFMYFMPIMLGSTAAKRFGCDQGVAMLLGVVLVSPSFITAVTEGVSMTIFGLPIYMANYTTSVIPIILVVYVMSYIEKFLKRMIPDILRGLIVPFVTLLVMLPISLVVVAPIGYYIGTLIVEVLSWLNSNIGFLAVAILAILLPLMVATGMHTLLTPIWTTAFATLGYDLFFLPVMIASNLNVATAALATALRSKKAGTKTTSFSASITAYLAGTTEPALFGTLLRLKKPLYATMIGNAVSGIIMGIFHVACYGFPGSGGLFAIPLFFGTESSNIIFFLIAVCAGMITTFVSLWVIGTGEE